MSFSRIFGWYSLSALVCYFMTLSDVTHVGVAYDFSALPHARIVVLYLEAVIPFLLGAVTFEYFGNRVYSQGLMTSSNYFGNIRQEKDLGRVMIVVKNLIWIYAALILVTYLITGAPLWSRDYYHLSEVGKAESEAAGSILDLLGAMGAMVISLAPILFRYFIAADGFLLWLMRILLIAVLLFLYGTGTKLIAVTAGLYLVAGVANGSRSINAARICMFFGVLILLALVLVQREDKLYGILTIPYAIEFLFEHPYDSLSFALQIIGSAVPITSETMADAGDSWDFLKIELNPASGFDSGWYQVYDLRRLSYSVPYGALGTLAAYSIFASYFYGALCASAMLMLARIFALYLGRHGNILLVLICIIVCGMLGQYNLRSVTRYIYYIILLATVVQIFVVFKKVSE